MAGTQPTPQTQKRHNQHHKHKRFSTPIAGVFDAHTHAWDLEEKKVFGWGCSDFIMCKQHSALHSGTVNYDQNVVVGSSE